MNRQIELLKPYGPNAKGAVLSPPMPVADLLIQRGVAKPVEQKPKGMFSKRAKKDVPGPQDGGAED